MLKIVLVQVYNIVLLIIVTMLYFTYSLLILLITENFCPYHLWVDLKDSHHTQNLPMLMLWSDEFVNYLDLGNYSKSYVCVYVCAYMYIYLSIYTHIYQSMYTLDTIIFFNYSSITLKNKIGLFHVKL